MTHNESIKSKKLFLAAAAIFFIAAVLQIIYKQIFKEDNGLFLYFLNISAYLFSYGLYCVLSLYLWKTITPGKNFKYIFSALFIIYSVIEIILCYLQITVQSDITDSAGRFILILLSFFAILDSALMILTLFFKRIGTVIIIFQSIAIVTSISSFIYKSVSAPENGMALSFAAGILYSCAMILLIYGYMKTPENPLPSSAKKSKATDVTH